MHRRISLNAYDMFETIVISLRLSRDDFSGEDQEPFQNAWVASTLSVGDSEDTEWIRRALRAMLEAL